MNNTLTLFKVNSLNMTVCVFINPLSANPTKWSNTLKQFVSKFRTNCFSVFDHFVGLVLNGLTWWRRPLYKNQSIDLLCKSMDWFLYDNSLRHERVQIFFLLMLGYNFLKDDKFTCFTSSKSWCKVYEIVRDLWKRSYR